MTSINFRCFIIINNNDKIIFKSDKITREIRFSEIDCFYFSKVAYNPGFIVINFGIISINNNYTELFGESYAVFLYRWKKFNRKLTYYSGFEVNKYSQVENINGSLSDR